MFETSILIFRFGFHAIYAEIAEGAFLRDGHLDEDDGGDQGVDRLQEDEQELSRSRRKEERGREEEKGEGENKFIPQIKIRGCS